MIGRVRDARYSPLSLALWFALATVALWFGRDVAKHSRLPFLALAAALAAFLVIRRQMALLVPITTLALVIGSSAISLGPISFYGKFLMQAAIVGTVPVILVLAPPNEPRIPFGFTLAFFGLAFLTLVSTGYSVAPSETLPHAISLLLLWAATAVAIPLWLRRPEDVPTLLVGTGTVAAGTVLAGFALSAAGRVTGYDAGRFQGVLGNPNTLGYFIGPILPALVLLAAQTEVRRRRRILVLVIAILTIGVTLSGSRAGIVSSAAGILGGLFLARGSWRIRQAVRIVTVGLLAVLVAAGLLYFLHRPLRPAEAAGGLVHPGTGSGRTVAWEQSLQLIAERPLLGQGFATTPVIFPEKQQAGLSLGRLHNSYLETALDIGWPGAIWMTLLGLSGLAAAWRLCHSSGPSRTMGAVLFAGILGGMVEVIFESGMLSAGGLFAFHFWLLVAIAHALRLRADVPVIEESEA